jgi:hypothetical protein
MHAEERVLRVRHRVDEAPDPVTGVRLQAEVLAAERDDLRCHGVAGLTGEQVGLQASADHQAVHVVGGALRDDAHAAA